MASIIKSGYLKDGWKLFDHGLMVSAEVEMAKVLKPFSENALRVWRVENKDIGLGGRDR